MAMRWQKPISWDNGGMYDDLSGRTMEELYEIERHIDERLIQLRLEEPAAKRKLEHEHRVWFSLCQHYLSDLRNVRDAIVSKRNGGGVE